MMKFDISNVEVYGRIESVIASGYPKSKEARMTGYNKDRADKLADNPAGTGHNCFLKGITIQADITAPQYWWLQWSRYSFSEIVSSQSKMHKITEMEIKGQCNNYVDDRAIELLECIVERYNEGFDSFQRVIANCPMGLMLTARITTNYLQEKTIYQQRRSHKLEEWQEYCDWLESLPNSEWIIGGGDN